MIKAIYLSVLIIIITVGLAYFVYPNNQLHFQPWHLGLDLIGGSHLIYEVDLSQVDPKDYDSVLAGLRDVIENRVNLFGVSEPQVYLSKTGQQHHLVVELAGIKDVGAAIKQIGLTPVLYFAEADTKGDTLEFKPTELTGRYIKGAQVNFNHLSQPQVSLTFNKEGAEIFAKLTKKNINKQIGVFIDNQLITAPVVQEEIIGGQAQITGRFNIEEARQMVERFNAGALPAPIKLINQQTIGASLGINSLRRTVLAGIIGSVVLFLFLMVYYRFLGVIASLALLVYIILSLSIFKIFGVTMTLSGIAGFILSIGMAVDANILIFERTKEEIKRGLSKLTAIDEGFKRAWPSIRDSNITTIITAVVLYYFTAGFVKGFALALFIGVIVSMFSAITVTRAFLKTTSRS